jgi:predicted peptidase
MNIRKIKFGFVAALAIGTAATSLISCGGSGTRQADSTAGGEQVEKHGGKVGGPQLGQPGGGPAIDKSGDATLQEMIRTVLPKFQQLEYTDAETGMKMRYNLYTPENHNGRKKYPLVLFIADASTPGDSVTLPLTQGYGGLIWATPESQAKNPCYVLVPQFAGVGVNDAYEHTDEVDVAMRLAKSVIAAKSVDPDRVYTTGQSMGGMISMYYNVTYPDVFAASIFVDCHWDTATFPELAKHKFVYFIAGDKGKAYQDIKPLEEAAEKDGVQYTFASWSAKLPEARQSELAATMLEKGAPINLIEFEPGTVLPEDGKGSEHMYSFDYAYKVTAVRDWLFKQKR